MSSMLKKLSIKKFTQPKWCVFFISLVLLIFSMLLVYHFRPFNSDDVSLQDMFQTWRPFKHMVLYISPDTWIVNVPFYIVISHFIAAGRRQLLLECGLFSVANFFLFYWSSLYFIKKFSIRLNNINLLPFIWLASFGYTFVLWFLNPNLRNFEIGLTFLMWALVSKVYFGEIANKRSPVNYIVGIIVSFFVGLLIYNDPYFFYFSVFPLVVFLVYLFIFDEESRIKLRYIFLLTVFSGIFYEILNKTAIKAGIHIVHSPTIFVTWNELFSQTLLALHGLVLIYGADFTGKNVFNIFTISALTNFIVLLFILCIAIRNLIFRKIDFKNRSERLILWKSFFAYELFFILIVYVMNGQDTVLPTYRYLIIFPFVATILLVDYIGSTKTGTRNILAILLVLATILNLATNINNTKLNQLNTPNKRNYQTYDMISALESHGLTKGYGQYWDSNITSYFSKKHLVVLPVMCNASGKTVPFLWMINRAEYSYPAQRTFIIVDNAPAACNLTNTLLQFGQPVSSFEEDGDMVLVYNYDINSKM